MSISKIQAALPKDSNIDWQNVEARERLIQSRIDSALEEERAKVAKEQRKFMEQLRQTMAD